MTACETNKTCVAQVTFKFVNKELDNEPKHVVFPVTFCYFLTLNDLRNLTYLFD